MQKLLTVVVPCYNEELVIRETHSQLIQALEEIHTKRQIRYELIYVDDGSNDTTLKALRDLYSSHSSASGDVAVLPLARNFGHQIALSAGLFHARGDAVIAIDADLQDPPEVMDKMVERWLNGADVVYGQRSSRAGESYFKVLTARAFYLLVRRITNINIPLDTGDFRLMSKRVLETFNDMPERHRYIRGMVPWVGFRQEPIVYNRAPRFAGETKYPLSKMLKLALDGITSFSNAPLRTAYLVGVGVAIFSIFYALYIIYHKLAYDYPVAGWSSIMVGMLFLGAVQLITIGILGEYIGRIYDQVKMRPVFTVDKAASLGIRFHD